MFISYSKATRCIDESFCLFVAGCDGCTADSEQGWQQQRNMYVIYVPSHVGKRW
jgi:hypothetical protein